MGRPLLRLDGESLTAKHIARVAAGHVRLSLSAAARRRMQSSRRFVEKLLGEERIAYGVNTGFGKLCRVRIPAGKVRPLQLNLLRSHAAGVGEALPDEVVRLAIALRANTLARGNSGVRVEVVEGLLRLYNEGVVPWIPSQGSVGASGDLAPLAHLALVLIGEGRARQAGEWAPAQRVLKRAGIRPLELHAKEGLALVNGVQVSTALLAVALLRAERILTAANVIGALTLDVLLGSLAPFDARIHAVRPHPGQAGVSADVRRLLAGSTINASHKGCDLVQDAYSLRCIPQVHGAVLDALEYIWSKVEIEANAATDNPLVFAEDESVLSGGNFHGAPIGYASDLLAIVLSDLGAMAERRIERVLNPDLHHVGLPAFLAGEEGTESGYMIAQVTAAALVAENRVLAHPASVDSVPTSGGTEDHVSMSTHAARKAGTIGENVARILAIELLVSLEALELRRPLRSGRAMERIVARLRDRLPRRRGDRPLTDEIEAAARLILRGEIGAAPQRRSG